jgi:hypothetical protein
MRAGRDHLDAGLPMPRGYLGFQTKVRDNRDSTRGAMRPTACHLHSGD